MEARVGVRVANPSVSLFFLILLLGSLSSCSLLTIKSPIEPLPEQEANARRVTRQFANRFAGKVQTQADTIIAHSDSSLLQSRALEWKINAIAANRAAALQTSPTLSLVDSWALCRQMTEFFESGNGKDLFEDEQEAVIAVSKSLESDLAGQARAIFPEGEMEEYVEFVETYVEAYPIENLSFSREPVQFVWEDLTGDPPPFLLGTFGTTPEVVNDFSDRLFLYGEQVPREARWQAQLRLLQYRAKTDSLELQARLDSLNGIMGRLADIAQGSTSLVDTAAERFHEEVELLVSQMDGLINSLEGAFGSSMDALKAEREAVVWSIDHEREALTQSLSEERMAVMEDLRTISEELTQETMVQVKGMIRTILFYGVLLSIVLVILPFGMGFLTGRIFTRKK